MQVIYDFSKSFANLAKIWKRQKVLLPLPLEMHDERFVLRQIELLVFFLVVERHNHNATYTSTIAGSMCNLAEMIRACSKVGLALPLRMAFRRAAVMPRTAAISFWVQ